MVEEKEKLRFKYHRGGEYRHSTFEPAVHMKEIPRRRITVTSFLYEINTDQLGKKMAVRGRKAFVLRPPFHSKCLKTT
jgi:hypothetical protein